MFELPHSAFARASAAVVKVGAECQGVNDVSHYQRMIELDRASWKPF